MRGEGVGFGDWESGVRGQGSGVRVLGPGVRGQGSGVRGQGSGVRDQESKCKVWWDRSLTERCR